MPLYLNVPLPGPFSFGTRIDTRGTGRVFYWLFIGWWFWLIVGLYAISFLLCWWTVLAAVWLVLWVWGAAHGDPRMPRFTRRGRIHWVERAS